MNAKMLMTPLLVVVIIALLIWFVYPAYSNGVDGVKEKYDQLKSEKVKYEGIKNKKRNVEKLFSKISSLGAEKDFLYRFIPENMKEEEIVDNLNYLASLVGVSVSQISIVQPSGKAVAVASESSETSSYALPQDIKVSIVLAGNYEKIKGFFEKVDKLERSADLSKLEISKIPASEENETAPDILSVKADINFNYLEKTKLSDSNASDSIFLSDRLNANSILEIKSKKTTEILNLNAGQKGKANPFMP